MVILITKHDKLKAPTMTPSKDTSDYFESLNIPCIVKSDRLKRKHSELKPFHGQRFIVMDEPEGNGNDQVVLSIIQEMKNPYVFIKDINQQRPCKWLTSSFLGIQDCGICWNRT